MSSAANSDASPTGEAQPSSTPVDLGRPDRAAQERTRAAGRLAVERITAAYCADRSLGEKALRALHGETERLLRKGQPVPADILQVIAAVENALHAA